jgi:pilus assembly protein Flp/PilA
MTFLRAIAADQDGATAIEYGLIAGLIAVAIVTAVTAVGGDLTGLFNVIAGDLQTATPSS